MKEKTEKFNANRWRRSHPRSSHNGWSVCQMQGMNLFLCFEASAAKADRGLRTEVTETVPFYCYF